MLRKLFKLVKVLSFLGAAAAAVSALRPGTSRAARPAPSVDTWPEVPRRD